MPPPLFHDFFDKKGKEALGDNLAAETGSQDTSKLSIQ